MATMTGGILAIGDELVTGQCLDTNSMWLAARLGELGIDAAEQITLGDDVEAITAAMQRLINRGARVIVATGGLGPTADDLTRHALAAVLGEELVEDAAALAELDGKMKARGRTMNPAQRIQVMRPASAMFLPNIHGTAPGIAASVAGAAGDAASSPGCRIICLPGPPRELKPMFEAHAVPLLPRVTAVVRTRILHCVGIGEADAATRLGSMLDRGRTPLIGITASSGIVSLRIRGEDPSAVDADAAAIRAKLSPHVFGEHDDSLPAAVLARLKSAQQTLSTVESCTGGGLGEAITAIPGSSAAFAGGLVTYSNELKTSLAAVPAPMIARHGAVSREVAEAMAVGGLARLGTSYCLSITGIAGPDGGTADKPVGTVWIALAAANDGATAAIAARRFHFPGDRDDVRSRSVLSALAMLWFHLAVPGWAGRLLWQRDAC